MLIRIRAGESSVARRGIVGKLPLILPERYVCTPKWYIYVPLNALPV